MSTRVLVSSLHCLLVVTVPLAVADEPHNQPPEGFIALFNGSDLSGWIGVPHFDPRKFREMTADERSQYLEKNWSEVEKHWSVENGELVNDGHGPYLTTAQDYGDFELHLEYKTVAKADSGIYLRGTPQVQIWDTTEEGGKWSLGADKGSGALWNNQRHPRFPIVHADKPFGEWNDLKITMIGDSVTIYLNDQLVVNETPLENFWDRSRPVFPVGPIQLQTHGGEIRFRNIFLRSIDRRPPEAGYLSKDGQPYGDGWQPMEAASESDDFRNFDLHVVFRRESDRPAQVHFRSTGGDAAAGLSLSISPDLGVLLAERKEGTPHPVASVPAESSGLKDDENHLYLRVQDDHIQAWLNKTPVVDVLYPHGPERGRVQVVGMNVAKAFVRNANDDERVEMFAGGEEGFESIFDGESLAGWFGDTNGYAAEPNILKATKQGGNLFYEPELSDFAFRFDFKFGPGANNGVGIRVPKGARATAYEGFESQILDNTDPQYADIKEWQAHGSIYGIIPAKRGYLAPVGHWNESEIIVEGSRFQVILNGKVIVDGNVKEAAAGGTPDGRDHPALDKTTGHLGFLGHGHEVKFRNLRVKRLGSK